VHGFSEDGGGCFYRRCIPLFPWGRVCRVRVRFSPLAYRREKSRDGSGGGFDGGEAEVREHGGATSAAKTRVTSPSASWTIFMSVPAARTRVAADVTVNTWSAGASDLSHVTVTHGYFMAEEAPADTSKALRDLLAR
jgi:hypothetical protein